MTMTLKINRLCIVAFLLSTVLIGLTSAEVLADSGYAVDGTNVLRNYHVNKKIICPAVAPGRTQVWNIEADITLPNNLTDIGVLTQDDEGFVYFACKMSGNSNVIFLKINLTSGTYDPDQIYNSSLSRADIPTHVKGNRMYLSGDDKTVVVNTITLQEIAAADNPPPTNYYRSYVPYGDDLMVTSMDMSSFGHILNYLNTTSFQFETDQPFDPVMTFARNVMIFKNASGVDIPIVSSSIGSPTYTPIILSPNYQILLDRPGGYVNTYIQNGELITLQYGSDPALEIVGFNANDGTLLRNISIYDWQGATIWYVTPLIVGNKSIGALYLDNEDELVVDILNNKTILNNFSAQGTQFSIPSNSALVDGVSYNDNLLLFVSVDWNTQTVNGVGSFLPEENPAEGTHTLPLIGDDCTIYSAYYDYAAYYKLHVFKPLPVSNIVPILECVNDNGVAYFSYRNYENKRIVIPFVSDRNNLSPMNMAPVRDFSANQRGKRYPFSSAVQLDNSTTSFTWTLEDFALSFSVSQRLRCPTSVALVLVFKLSTTTIPPGFLEWTRQTFVTIAQISLSRVNVTSSRVILSQRRATESSDQTELEVELLVGPDPSGQEKTAEEVVQSFIGGSQNIDTLNQFVSNSSFVPLGVLSVKSIDGVPLASELSGDLSPQYMPSSTQPSGDSQPPTNDNNTTPKSNQVSSSVTRSIDIALILSSWLSLTICL